MGEQLIQRILKSFAGQRRISRIYDWDAPNECSINNVDRSANCQSEATHAVFLVESPDSNGMNLDMMRFCSQECEDRFEEAYNALHKSKGRTYQDDILKQPDSNMIYRINI